MTKETETRIHAFLTNLRNKLQSTPVQPLTRDDADEMAALGIGSIDVEKQTVTLDTEKLPVPQPRFDADKVTDAVKFWGVIHHKVTNHLKLTEYDAREMKRLNMGEIDVKKQAMRLYPAFAEGIRTIVEREGRVSSAPAGGGKTQIIH